MSGSEKRTVLENYRFDDSDYYTSRLSPGEGWSGDKERPTLLLVDLLPDVVGNGFDPVIGTFEITVKFVPKP